MVRREQNQNRQSRERMKYRLGAAERFLYVALVREIASEQIPRHSK